MDDNTRIKAWRNNEKKSSEFFKYYMNMVNNSKGDWHEVLNKMTKKELLEFWYSAITHDPNKAERWKGKFEQTISQRYLHGGKL